MAITGEIVHVVLCHENGDGDVRHIFSTRALAEDFMQSDPRDHVYYEYAIDCPERHEGRQN